MSNAADEISFTLAGWRVSGSCTAPWTKHQHVLRVSIKQNFLTEFALWLVRSILPQRLARACLPTAWSLPNTVIVKKEKRKCHEEFTTELDMYKRLGALQGKQIPVCYGKAFCDGTRALVLQEVGGVSLLHRSALLETTEEQMMTMISRSYRPMTDRGIAYDDWKPDNFRLVDGEIVFLDLEHAYVLDQDKRQYTIEIGLDAFLDRWKRARKQYEKFGEIEC
ncbi:hypothetical protein LLEC1_03257 [Akanthomyces lecanii]|uniref:Protein kinase domain-containing protein n=1 Tax=Cordyceps confragosa TaxID=2714763 RepID=A0A179IJN9_CORDF|nr:hypothetical protein LLEC1_03257 [Akanthomyces lecanii]